MLAGFLCYARLRQVPTTLLVIVCTGLTAAVFGNIRIPALSATLDDSYAATVLLAVAPLVMAVSAGFGLRGDFAIWNRLAARDLSLPSLACTGGIVLCCVIALVPAVVLSDRADALGMTLENVSGAFAVLVLLGCFLEPRHIWPVLFPYGILGLLAGQALDPRASGLLVVNAVSSQGELIRNLVLLLMAETVYLLVERRRSAVEGFVHNSLVWRSAGAASAWVSRLLHRRRRRVGVARREHGDATG